MDVFQHMAQLGVASAFYYADEASGLRAILVVDDTRLGPAAGGVRTRAYDTLDDALTDAAGLARSMTLKNALAGLDAGGAKMVVLDHPGLKRDAAFRFLGRRVQDMRGLFRTAGDLGTTAEDLEHMARETEFVHTNELPLANAVAHGLLRCVEALADSRGRTLNSLRMAVQGAGSIGAAVTQTLCDAGGTVSVADLDPARARSVAERTGAMVMAPEDWLAADQDILVPCAVGGVLSRANVEHVRAWGVCGAANGVLADRAAGRALHQRGVVVVPDILASAGAVIEGIGDSVMGLPDRTPLIDRLGELTRAVLERSGREDRPPAEVAHTLALQRLERARPTR